MAEDYKSPPSMLPEKIGKPMKETNGKFPIKICQIDQIEIRTENLAAMIKFYSGVLGCDIIQTSAETLTVRLGAGRSLIDLRDISTGSFAQPVIAGQKSSTISLRLDDWEEKAIIQHLEKHGLTVCLAKPKRFGSRDYSVSVNDPDGNLLLLRPVSCDTVAAL